MVTPVLVIDPAVGWAENPPAVVMVRCATVVNVSMSAVAVAVVMVNVPVAPVTPGFLMFVNVNTCAPALATAPPERVIVSTCEATLTVNVPSNPPLVFAATGVPVKS